MYAENSFGDKDDILCYISSPIYVDSRKEARKKLNNGDNAQNSISIKKFFTAVGGIKGIIQNNSDSFIKYYTAQSIRGKIKHPLYVAYHFDKVFEIYFNTEHQTSVSEALEEFNRVKDSNASNSSDSKNEKKSIFYLLILEKD